MQNLAEDNEELIEKINSILEEDETIGGSNKYEHTIQIGDYNIKREFVLIDGQKSYFKTKRLYKRCEDKKIDIESYTNAEFRDLIPHKRMDELLDVIQYTENEKRNYLNDNLAYRIIGIQKIGDKNFKKKFNGIDFLIKEPECQVLISQKNIKNLRQKNSTANTINIHQKNDDGENVLRFKDDKNDSKRKTYLQDNNTSMDDVRFYFKEIVGDDRTNFYKNDIIKVVKFKKSYVQALKQYDKDNGSKLFDKRRTTTYSLSELKDKIEKNNIKINADHLQFEINVAQQIGDMIGKDDDGRGGTTTNDKIDDILKPSKGWDEQREDHFYSVRDGGNTGKSDILVVHDKMKFQDQNSVKQKRNPKPNDGKFWIEAKKSIKSRSFNPMIRYDVKGESFEYIGNNYDPEDESDKVLINNLNKYLNAQIDKTSIQEMLKNTCKALNKITIRGIGTIDSIPQDLEKVVYIYDYIKENEKNKRVLSGIGVDIDLFHELEIDVKTAYQKKRDDNPTRAFKTDIIKIATIFRYFNPNKMKKRKGCFNGKYGSQTIATGIISDESKLNVLTSRIRDWYLKKNSYYCVIGNIDDDKDDKKDIKQELKTSEIENIASDNKKNKLVNNCGVYIFDKNKDPLKLKDKISLFEVGSAIYTVRFDSNFTGMYFNVVLLMKNDSKDLETVVNVFKLTNKDKGNSDNIFQNFWNIKNNVEYDWGYENNEDDHQINEITNESLIGDFEIEEGLETSKTKSNEYELEVTKALREFLHAQKSPYNTLEVEHYEEPDMKYWSDIKVTNVKSGKRFWVEAKENKYACFSGPSFKYIDGKWTCTTIDEKDNLSKFMLKSLQDSSQKFIRFCKEYLGKEDIKLPSDITDELAEAWKTSGNIEDTENDVLFITNKIPVEDFGSMVASFYRHSKKEPAYYIHVGDVMYLVDKDTNIMNLVTKDGKDLKTLSEAYRIGRIQFRLKRYNRPQKMYYSIYEDIKILSDKENDDEDYKCSLLTKENWPVIRENGGTTDKTKEMQVDTEVETEITEQFEKICKEDAVDDVISDMRKVKSTNSQNPDTKVIKNVSGSKTLTLIVSLDGRLILTNVEGETVRRDDGGEMYFDDKMDAVKWAKERGYEVDSSIEDEGLKEDMDNVKNLKLLTNIPEDTIKNILDNQRIENKRYDRAQFTKYFGIKETNWTCLMDKDECLAIASLANDNPFNGYTFIQEVQTLKKGFGRYLLEEIFNKYKKVSLMADTKAGEDLLNYYRSLKLEEILVVDSIYGCPAYFFCTKDCDYDKLEAYFIAFYSNDEGEVEELDEKRKFDFRLKDKEHTYNPEKNRYAFKNRTETYGGDDCLLTGEIIDKLDVNMHARGVENWFRGPECLDSEKSRVYARIDDGNDTTLPITDVIRSKENPRIVYVITSKSGNGMKSVELGSKLSQLMWYIGRIISGKLVIMNEEDETVYVCNGMRAEGNDVILEFEWGDLVDYSKELKEAEQDIGGEKSDIADEVKGVKIWIDDIREAPEGFLWFKKTREFIEYVEKNGTSKIELIDTDHDAGDYQKFGGDYIRCFDYLDFIGAKDITIHIHSANPVGANNIRRIISKNKEENNWKEVRNT